MSTPKTILPRDGAIKKGGTYGARVTPKAGNGRKASSASLNTKQYSSHNPPASADKTRLAAIIARGIQLGLIHPPAPPAPRIKRGLSATEHTRRRRAKFYAAGLTARGTQRIKRGYGINLNTPLETDARLRSTFNVR